MSLMLISVVGIATHGIATTFQNVYFFLKEKKNCFLNWKSNVEVIQMLCVNTL